MTAQDDEADWAGFFKKCLEDLHWPPHLTAETHPQFWHSLAGGGGPQKIHAKTFEELQPHIQKYLEESSPDGQLRKAREAVEAEAAFYAPWWDG